MSCLNNKTEDCLIKNNCVYCGNHSFGQWHIECLRLFTYLSTIKLKDEEIAVILKEKWENSIKHLYNELICPPIKEEDEETTEELIEQEETE